MKSKKLIMLTGGSYDEYRVTGLYYVDADLNLTYEKLWDLRNEYARSLGITFNEPPSIGSITEDNGLLALHKEAVVGRKRPKIGYSQIYDYKSECEKYEAEYCENKSETVDFMSWLIKKGTLTPVEYDVIHDDVC